MGKRLAPTLILLMLVSAPYLSLDLSQAEISVDPLLTITASNTNELFGWNMSSAGDLNKDGRDDLIVGAPGFDSNRGRAYVFFGSDKLLYGFNSSDADIVINGSLKGENFGWDVDGAGDFNGNGYPDVIIGAPGNSNTSVGKSYLIDGYLLVQESMNDGFINLTTDTVNYTFVSHVLGDRFGSAVAGAGDLNGGDTDLIIGAPNGSIGHINKTTTSEFSAGTYDSSNILVSGDEVKLGPGGTLTWNSQTDFDNCSKNFVTSYSSGNVTLEDTLGVYENTGNLVSQVIDATIPMNWNSISWVEDAPYGDPLPSNGINESGKYGVNMSGCVLLMHLDENALNNTPIEDFSGMGNNGTLLLNSTTQNSTMPGIINTSIYFDKQDDYINITDHDSLNMTNNLSIACWVKFPNVLIYDSLYVI